MTGDKGLNKQRVKVTETFRVVWYEDVNSDILKEVTYTKVVCELRPQKDNPNRTQITIGGKKYIFPGNVATPIASLKLTNTIINSVLSLHGVKLAWYDVIFLSFNPDGQIIICQNQD